MIIRVTPADGKANLQLSTVANAWAGMQQYLSTLQDLKLTVGDDRDQGWRELRCPSCGCGIDPYWFAGMVEAQMVLARVSKMVTMPCCNSNLSIPSLCRQKREHLSGFVLSFRSLGREMDQRVVRNLEQVLNCQLNIHYDVEQQD